MHMAGKSIALAAFIDQQDMPATSAQDQRGAQTGRAASHHNCVPDLAHELSPSTKHAAVDSGRHPARALQPNTGQGKAVHGLPDRPERLRGMRGPAGGSNTKSRSAVMRQIRTFPWQQVRVDTDQRMHHSCPGLAPPFSLGAVLHPCFGHSGSASRLQRRDPHIHRLTRAKRLSANSRSLMRASPD